MKKRMVSSHSAPDAMKNSPAKRWQHRLDIIYVLEPPNINVQVKCTFIFERYNAVWRTDFTQGTGQPAQFFRNRHRALRPANGLDIT